MILSDYDINEFDEPKITDDKKYILIGLLFNNIEQV